MDVVMPGTNGFQATRAITRDEATKHIPVIVVTSKNQETDRVWGMRQGAKDYLMKPIDAKELLAKVAAIKEGSGRGKTDQPARVSAGARPEIAGSSGRSQA